MMGNFRKANGVRIVLLVGLLFFLSLQWIFPQGKESGEEESYFINSRKTIHELGYSYTGLSKQFLSLYPGYESGASFGNGTRDFHGFTYMFSLFLTDNFALAFKFGILGEFNVKNKKVSGTGLYELLGRFYYYFTRSRFAPYMGFSMGFDYMVGLNESPDTTLNNFFQNDAFLSWDVLLGLRIFFFESFGISVEGGFPHPFFTATIFISDLF